MHTVLLTTSDIQDLTNEEYNMIEKAWKQKKVAAKASLGFVASTETSEYWAHQAEMIDCDVVIKTLYRERVATELSTKKLAVDDEERQRNIQKLAEIDTDITELETKRAAALKTKSWIDRSLVELATQTKKALTVPELDRSTTAFMDLLLDKFRENKGKGFYKAPQEFKEGLVLYYEAAENENASYFKGLTEKKRSREIRASKIWCPITQAYSSYASRTAAHIAPKRLGPVIMTLLFGEANWNDPMSARNGLLLHPEFETLFDNLEITIVPLSNDPDEKDLKVRLMRIDRQFLESEIEHMPGYTYADLQDRPLRFSHTNNRPARRYFYFMYCVALLVPKDNYYIEALHREMEDSADIWAAPGKWIPENFLRRVAAAVGHDYATLFHPELHAAPLARFDQEDFREYCNALDEMEKDEDE